MSESSEFYDSLELSLAEAFRLLTAGAQDRRSAAHTPAVATINGDGAPSQRVMILRHVDMDRRTLRFHTDSRSIKMVEAGSASVLVYDPEAKIQLRLSGLGRFETASVATDEAWASSTLFARRCYMAEVGPGALSPEPISGLPTWIEGLQPDEAQVASARANFAILLVEFHQIEWLYLANSGHRRARWTWDRQEWKGSWLVP